MLDREHFSHADFGPVARTRELDSSGPAPVLQHLWRFLYLYYYAGDNSGAAILMKGVQRVTAVQEWEDPALGARLSAVGAGRTFLSGGWRLIQNDGTTLRAERNGVQVTVSPDEVDPVAPAVGSPLSIRLPAHRRYAEARWFTAISSSGPPPGRAGGLIRHYFTPDDADAGVALMERMFAELDPASPFQVKLLNCPTAYERRDSFVLYLDREHNARCVALLERVHGDFAGRLRDDGPCFARRLARGWHVALDPPPRAGGGTLSFGQDRCILIAEALFEAYSATPNRPEDRYAAIVRRYSAEGLDIHAPYGLVAAEMGCAVAS